MKIAVLGYGVIGRGVVEICLTKKEIELVKIFDRKEKFDKQLIDLFTDNIDEILNDDSIELIVEVLGGYDFAKRIAIDAITRHKHFVTANKEVVAKDIDELSFLARQNCVAFCYEASVGGTIPIVKNLKALTLVNEITKITGILNGTTNYILSRMKENFSFEDALLDAKQKGFAESNPSFDLEGFDMMRKIAILSDLAWNTKIDIKQIKHVPVTEVKKYNLKKISKEKKTLKYICEATKIDQEIHLSVQLVALENDDLLSHINDEYNAVIIETKPAGKFVFVGKGAGSLPTAAAIVGDIYDILHQRVLDVYYNKNLYKIQ